MRGGGGETNWGSMHKSPRPIRVTHLPFLRFMMLTVVMVGNNCTHHCTGRWHSKKKTKQKGLPEMRLAIPSTRLCYWSLCNDLPKDPDFLATACHKNIWQEFNILSPSLPLSLSLCVSLCEKWQCCLPALRLPPALLLLLKLLLDDEPVWLQEREPSNNSVFIQSHHIVAGTLREPLPGIINHLLNTHAPTDADTCASK